MIGQMANQTAFFMAIPKIWSAINFILLLQSFHNHWALPEPSPLHGGMQSAPPLTQPAGPPWYPSCRSSWNRCTAPCVDQASDLKSWRCSKSVHARMGWWVMVYLGDCQGCKAWWKCHHSLVEYMVCPWRAQSAPNASCFLCCKI